MTITGTAKVYDHKKGVWLDVPCELTISTAAVIQALGVKAVRAKGKRAVVLGGLVTLRVTS